VAEMNDTDFVNYRIESLSDRIRRDIEARIQKGLLRPGEKLPPELEYARMLGVSRNSLREALRSLENSGLVVKRHGIGTFVTESKPVIRGGIERLTGIMQLIKDQGLAPGSRIIDFRYDKSDTEISDKLLLEPRSEVVILETVKVAAGCPVASCLDVLPTKYLQSTVDPETFQESIFDGLERYHRVNIRFAECEIVPTTADRTLASKLEIEPSTPLLLLSQVHFDDQDRRVLYSKSYFPFNRFAFRLIRRR